ncbi:MAG TPA: serine/threonine-protein kinase [Gemmataceae bacterium]|nr:serine/threonine-protein kinase [Gemmataceae bacterium]
MIDPLISSSPPLALLQQANALCDRLEDGWRAGNASKIELLLANLAEADREFIFRKLLELEVELRQALGQNPQALEYAERFPHYTSIVNEVFTARPSSSTVDSLPSTPPPNGLSSAWSPGPFFVGQTINGYELLEKIGQGGMGAVFKARQIKAGGRLVALKCIRPDYLDGLPEKLRAEAVARFQAEARAVAKLDHPNLVTVYDVGDVDGCPYFTMQYVPGGSLSKLLESGPLASREAAVLFEQLARAVHHAHQHSILHRDLKPGNILLTGSERPGSVSDGGASVAYASGSSSSLSGKIADFGLAKQLEPLQMQATPSRAELGTPSYMSPEQARGNKAIDARTDVYGLGATLYHALTGRPPFEGENSVQIMRQVLDDRPGSPRRVNNTVEPGLEAICLKCLAKKPGRRYASAAELADDLKQLLGAQKATSRAALFWISSLRWLQRRWRIILLLVAVALAATAVDRWLLRARTPIPEPPAQIANEPGVCERDEVKVRVRMLEPKTQEAAPNPDAMLKFEWEIENPNPNYRLVFYYKFADKSNTKRRIPGMAHIKLTQDDAEKKHLVERPLLFVPGNGRFSIEPRLYTSEELKKASERAVRDLEDQKVMVRRVHFGDGRTMHLAILDWKNAGANFAPFLDVDFDVMENMEGTLVGGRDLSAIDVSRLAIPGTRYFHVRYLGMRTGILQCLAMLRHCDDLRTLDIVDCDLPVDWAVRMNFARMHVKQLLVAEGTVGDQPGGSFTDSDLRLISTCQEITHMYLANQRRVTPEGLRQLAKLPNLKLLELHVNDGQSRGFIDTETLRFLLVKCPNLRFNLLDQKNKMHLRLAEIGKEYPDAEGENRVGCGTDNRADIARQVSAP